ncbi:MAG: isochorismatase family protein [Devosia sp.]|nr:isochorismatase family protein [Devosia sp.]
MHGNAPVIVVDLQTGMFDGRVAPPLHDAEGLVARARKILSWARRSGHGVAFVQQNSPPGDQLAPGAAGWAIWPALGQGADEPTFGKTVENAFTSEELRGWVTALGTDEVIVIGAATNHCVTSTVEGALAEGLKVTVVSDAHSTGSRPGAPGIIAAHNAAFAAAGARLVTTDELTAAGT